MKDGERERNNGKKVMEGEWDRGREGGRDGRKREI